MKHTSLSLDAQVWKEFNEDLNLKQVSLLTGMRNHDFSKNQTAVINSKFHNAPQSDSYDYSHTFDITKDARSKMFKQFGEDLDHFNSSPFRQIKLRSESTMNIFGTDNSLSKKNIHQKSPDVNHSIFNAEQPNLFMKKNIAKESEIVLQTQEAGNTEKRGIKKFLNEQDVSRKVSHQQQKNLVEELYRKFLNQNLTNSHRLKSYQIAVSRRMSAGDDTSRKERLRNLLFNQ